MACVDDGLLMALIDGELHSNDSARVRAHLDECSKCRDRLVGLRQDAMAVSTGLDQLTQPKAMIPPISALPVPEATALRRRLPSWWLAPVAAAAVLTVIVISLTSDPPVTHESGASLTAAEILELEQGYYDPNTAWAESQVVISLQDMDGTVTNVIVATDQGDTKPAPPGIY